MRSTTFFLLSLAMTLLHFHERAYALPQPNAAVMAFPAPLGATKFYVARDGGHDGGDDGSGDNDNGGDDGSGDNDDGGDDGDRDDPNDPDRGNFTSTTNDDGFRSSTTDDHGIHPTSSLNFTASLTTTDDHGVHSTLTSALFTPVLPTTTAPSLQGSAVTLGAVAAPSALNSWGTPRGMVGTDTLVLGLASCYLLGIML